ncbi:hypothetical protein PTSG_05649 [Salpingoeca rosetta]|uniref:EF-hand domain-containing protein n=1 Tax=Salpingoeca rosetta (strain ATCC 50818 / BSB-021) TaxID=946362 RepID=F2UBT9_SALR5|nr:uncharacterized protein PTSG_05649 [Salpingoeca rosetta]EGD73955.1 hypothetical protein PTSG_05649 [Salpingoeca rosetta]|eukprot:XP_004993518.1 hypothetical protein PTSG_05649 [Salpingoeca rosetta]
MDVKEVFDLYDVEGEGYIPSNDLGNVLRAFGHNPTESELQELLLTVDSGSGRLSLQEVNTCVSNFKGGADYAQQVREVDNMMREAGFAGKSSISQDEFIKLMLQPV